MNRDCTQFDRRYEHVSVSLEQITAIEAETKLRLKAGIASLEIRPKTPPAFKDSFAATWKDFTNIWKNYPKEIRKFDVVFSGEKFTRRADTVCVELFVRNQGHYGEAHEKEIILRGYNCYKHDFEVFCSICEKQLNLNKAPKRGFDMQHGRLIEQVESMIESPALATAIKGALAHKNYDEAIRSAMVMVEDELRKKCLSVGASGAAGQTGADLAKTAYHDASGCLIPPWPIATSALDGAHLLFRGFFLYLRNAWGHSSVVMGSDHSAVTDCIAACQFFLKVIDKSTKR